MITNGDLFRAKLACLLCSERRRRHVLYSWIQVKTLSAHDTHAAVIALPYAESMFAAWIEEEMDLRSGQASGQAGCDTTLGDATAVHVFFDENGGGEMVSDGTLADFAGRTCRRSGYPHIVEAAEEEFVRWWSSLVGKLGL